MKYRKLDCDAEETIEMLINEIKDYETIVKEMLICFDLFELHNQSYEKFDTEGYMMDELIKRYDSIKEKAIQAIVPIKDRIMEED